MGCFQFITSGKELTKVLCCSKLKGFFYYSIHTSWPDIYRELTKHPKRPVPEAVKYEVKPGMDHLGFFLAFIVPKAFLEHRFIKKKKKKVLKNRDKCSYFCVPSFRKASK